MLKTVGITRKRWAVARWVTIARPELVFLPAAVVGGGAAFLAVAAMLRALLRGLLSPPRVPAVCADKRDDRRNF